MQQGAAHEATSQALACEWNAAPRLALVLAAAHILSIIAILGTHLPGWIRAITLLCLLASAAYHIDRTWRPLAANSKFRQHTPLRFTGLRLKRDGTGAVRTLDGRWLEARIGAVFAAPLFAIIKVKNDDWRGPRFVLLSPDMLAAEDYRRLLVRLRWGAHGI
jgi:hypothetical protein